MADPDISAWWQVGEAPDLTKWCEKNVADACDEVARQSHITIHTDENLDTLNEPLLGVWCSIWDDYQVLDQGRFQPLRRMLAEHLDQHKERDGTAPGALPWLNAAQEVIAEAILKAEGFWT